MDHRLLDILVCPVTKGPLEYDKVRQELISRSAGLAYPIRDDIAGDARKRSAPARRAGPARRRLNAHRLPARARR
jgi:uncharacterized protein